MWTYFDLFGLPSAGVSRVESGSNTFILFISVNISAYVNLDGLKIILEVLEHSDSSGW